MSVYVGIIWNLFLSRVQLQSDCFEFFSSLPDLLSEVKLTVGEISRDLTELVHTFRSVTIRLLCTCQTILRT